MANKPTLFEDLLTLEQAAKEMGGRLVAESDGISRGATFTLELPIAQMEAAA